MWQILFNNFLIMKKLYSLVFVVLAFVLANLAFASINNSLTVLLVLIMF